MRTLVLIVSALLGSAASAEAQRLTAARLDGGVLHLDVSDNPQTIRHFPLPSPPRVVVDLFGIASSVAEMPMPSEGSPAFEVRTGRHPSFLRVVLDLHQALSSYQVRQSAGRIEVALGSALLPPSSTGVLVDQSPVPGESAATATAPALASVPAVAVEADAVPAATATPVDARAASEPTLPPEPLSSEGLTTDELLALIEAELEAARLDQEQSAEDLIEEVEAELEANEREVVRRRIAAGPPSTTNRPPPFRFVDEEPVSEPSSEEPPDGQP